MMSSTPDSTNHLQTRKPTLPNNTQTSPGNKKPATIDSSSPSDNINQQALKCPRCDSPNTKFCYYNNYSLTQPRHFCKTCRRYWTKGGALRNVPIGGGCRKSKKTKSFSSASGLCFSSNMKQDYFSGSDEFKLFHGGFSPSFDQLGRIPFSRLTSSSSISTDGFFNNNQNHQLVSFGDLSSNSTPLPSSGSTLMGFNHLGSSSSSVFKQGDNSTTELFNGGGELVHHSHQDMGSMNANSSNLASTMEPLSSMNQEMHWKLQQERLSMLFGGDGNQNSYKEITSSSTVSSVSGDQNQQKPLPISFQNLEISKQELVGDGGNPSKKGSHENGNEWMVDQNSYNSSIPTTTITNNSSSWKGIQAWSDQLHNYM